MSNEEAEDVLSVVFVAVIALFLGAIFGAVCENDAYREDIKKGYLQWTGKFEREQIKALESRLPNK